MRILNLQSRDFVNSFQAFGHKVLSVGEAPENDVRVERALSLAALREILHSRGFVPDMIFWSDDCRPPVAVGFERLPSVTLGFSIDQYCNPWHVPFSSVFDTMLLAQKDYLPLFRLPKITRPVEWFPLFCDPSRDRDLEGERDIPVSFVGTLEGRFNKDRKPFLTAFRSKAPLFVTSGDYVPIFNRSRLVLNQSAVGELNFRIFQSMACGSVCLTEETENGLADLFAPGRELFVYPRGDAVTAARVAREVLARADLQEIAQAGRDKVLARHSVERRAKHILRMGHKLLKEQSFKNRLQRMDLVQHHLRNTWSFLATDDVLPLPREHRDFYKQLAMR